MDSMILKMQCMEPVVPAGIDQTCMYGVSLRNRKGPRKSRTLIQVKPVPIHQVKSTLAKHFSWSHVCEDASGFLVDGCFSIVVHMSLYTGMCCRISTVDLSHTRYPRTAH